MSATNDVADSVSAANDSSGAVTAPDPAGRAVDPDLLRVIHRVAHREHLFAGPSGTRNLATGATARTTSNRPVRHRPVTVSDVPRPARGTTARKVTWSR